MDKLSRSDNTWLLRTDFSNDAAWATLCKAVQVPSEEGFLPNLDFISNSIYNELTVEQLVKLAPKGGDHNQIIAFVADRFAFSNTELPVLVVDLYHEPGRSFRVIPSEMWGVENNLSLANMDYEDFADHTDPDGVFRGFPEG